MPKDREDFNSEQARRNASELSRPARAVRIDFRGRTIENTNEAALCAHEVHGAVSRARTVAAVASPTRFIYSQTSIFAFQETFRPPELLESPPLQSTTQTKC